MRKIFLSFFLFFLFVMTSAQWSPVAYKGGKINDTTDPKNLYSLDISLLRAQLSKAQETGRNAKPVIISLPTLDGKIEKFAVYSFPVVVKELQDQYQLGSYVGAGVDDPGKYIRFSTAPNDFQSMVIKNGIFEFIEPTDNSRATYGVHSKKENNGSFVCGTHENFMAKKDIEKLYEKGKAFNHQGNDFARSSDKKFRTLRLAISANGDYTQFHGGTVAGALTAINATITRVNGIFEKDFAVHLDVQNFPTIIYTNPATDPYTNPGAGGDWNIELQQTLANNVGHANFDIGHLFLRTSASTTLGNAGCVGCVCVNPGTPDPDPNIGDGKGSGWSSADNGIPQGDGFDIRVVAHEMGHQLGASHTFSHVIENGNPTQMEPGSGSTIMGYAGGTGQGNDVQGAPDPYFHVVSIEQVQAKLVQRTCDIETPTVNQPPVIEPLPSLYIPNQTAFVLTASATDPENDPLTYTWEQAYPKPNTAINAANLGTAYGSSFRSMPPTTNPTRYFPRFSSVMAGVLNNSNGLWESVTQGYRSMYFIVTVRDNHPDAKQQQTATTRQEIAAYNDGPFKVNTPTVFNNGLTPVQWDVVNTNSAPYNVSYVKIDFTMDNGITWTTVATSTPNDGTEYLDFGNITAGSTIKIRISAIGNVFYAIGNAVVDTYPPCSGTPPIVTVSNVTTSTALVSWNAVSGASYAVQYRPVGSPAWITVTPNPIGNSVLLNAVTDNTQYEVQVANICSGTQGNFSQPVQFTTLPLTYCTPTVLPPSNTYITNVTVISDGGNIIANNSGASAYTDYSTNPTQILTLIKGTVNNQLSLSVTDGTFTSPIINAKVWIDFNRNGNFEDTERLIYFFGTANNVNTAFTVPVSAYSGPLITKMRVAVNSYIASPTQCQTTNGEFEDYAVRLVEPQLCSTTPPSYISFTNIDPVSTTVSWLSTSGAIYTLRYRQIGASVWTTINSIPSPGNIYNMTGLTEQTQYEVQVASACNGTQGSFSASATFTTPAVVYCSFTPYSNNNSYISNITVNAVNSYIMSSTTQANSYSDYTSDPAKLITFVRNSSGNTVSVSPSWLDTFTEVWVKVWIDFNRDGVFTASEQIMDANGNTTNPLISVPFTIPAGSYVGASPLKMRVIMSDSGLINGPCAPLINGEVEDYPVKIVDIQPCTVAPPANITITNMTSTTAVVSWIASTGGTYILRYRQAPSGAWTTVPLNTSPVNNYTITGLTEQTPYEVQVATVCNGTAGAFSPSVSFTTPPLTYCPMVGLGTNYHISNVTVTPVNLGIPAMSNTSVQNNYTNYTTPNTLITLETGSSGNTISVTKGFTGLASPDRVSAWIDFNRNGVFETSEQIVNSVSDTNPVTTLFDVPSNVYSGPLTTTMRVIVKRGSSPVLCQNIANGEIEDYAVRFKPCSNTMPGIPTFNTVTHNSVIMNWTPAPGNLSFVLQYRVQGTTAWTTANVFSTPFTLTGLASATTYEFQVAANCSGIPGTFTPIQVFTTKCDPTPPAITISAITTNSAVITWAPVAAGSTYIMRWREVGTAMWNPVNLPAPPANSFPLTGLDSGKTYEVQIANHCIGEPNPNGYSSSEIFTTLRTCEAPPSGLLITTLTPTSAVVVWDPFPAATYILRYKKAGIPSWTEISVPTNTYTLTGLTELTNYEMQVANICSGGPGNFTPTHFFKTPTVIYCQMSSTSSANEFISNVTVSPNGKPQMSNDSGASNYTDYSGTPSAFIELIQGSTGNQISIEKSWTGTQYNEGIAVWIDFDRNGTFDIHERILASPANTSSPVTGTFNVPVDAFISMTDYKYVVMRVAMQRDGIPINCTDFPNGEVEDYTVRISKTPVHNPLNQNDILIYPNPVKTVLYIKNISKKVNYKIYSAAGQLVSSGILLDNQINVANLLNGIYILDIEDNSTSIQEKFVKE